MNVTFYCNACCTLQTLHFVAKAFAAARKALYPDNLPSVSQPSPTNTAAVTPLMTIFPALRGNPPE